MCISKEEKDEIINKMLKTRYGKEALRRCIIEGLQDVASGRVIPTPLTKSQRELEISSEKFQILAQATLESKIFGDIPDKWEENPYRWCREEEFDNQ